MTITKGKLYLIPSGLGSENLLEQIPAQVYKVIEATNHYIVENEKIARRFIKQVAAEKPQSELVIYAIDKHKETQLFDEQLALCKQGISIGLLSDAGAPGIADPGATVVSLAHELGISVVPLTGPSSILLAMMASGLNGQNFAFNGYLPVKNELRKTEIKKFEKKSREINQSQVFIETPYRNNQLFDEFKNLLSSKTMLCVACNISLETEFIRTLSIERWKKINIDLHKKPSIFIIHQY